MARERHLKAVQDQLDFELDEDIRLAREAYERFVGSRCYAPGCEERATHAACGTWVRGAPTDQRHGVVRIECCLRHANYYADAWIALGFPPWSYPNCRDVSWLEVLDAPSAG